MIIFKNLSWQTRSDKPFEDWTGDAKYIIDDNSELAQKIIDCKYGFTIIEDDEGNLIDIIPKAKPLDEIKQDKIKEIVSTSTEISQAGIDYTYNGITSHYSLTLFDMACLTTRAEFAKQGKTVSWHADGEGCRLYSPEEFLGLFVTADLFATHHQTYSNCLKHQVEEMTDINEIKAVVYGSTPLNAEKQAEYEIIMTNERMNLGVKNTE